MWYYRYQIRYDNVSDFIEIQFRLYENEAEFKIAVLTVMEEGIDKKRHNKINDFRIILGTE